MTITLQLILWLLLTIQRKLLGWTRSNFIIRSELSESDWYNFIIFLSEMITGNFFNFLNSSFKENRFVFQENWSKWCLAIGMSSLASLVRSHILGEIATFSQGHVMQPFCSGTGMEEAVGLAIIQAVSTIYFISKLLQLMYNILQWSYVFHHGESETEVSSSFNFLVII